MSSMIYGVVSYLSTSYASGSARYHPDSKASRRLACAKSSMLQENNPDAACMYEYIVLLIFPPIGTYLVCCFVQGRAECAVLCSLYCCRYSTTTHPTAAVPV